MIKKIVKKLIYLLGLDISKVGNILGSLRKNSFNFLRSGRSRIKYVNVGGGPFYKPGWGVLDNTGGHYSYFPGTVDWQHNFASLDPFPLNSDSVKLFYSSHCFEHIPDRFHNHNFKELYRCLEPGGTVRITTPEFDKGYEAARNNRKDFFKGYICNKGEDIFQGFICYFCSDFFEGRLKTSDICQSLKEMTKEDFIKWVTIDVPEEWVKEHQGHVSIWYFDKFRKFLKGAGFQNVELSMPGESRFSEMRGSGFAWAFDNRFPKGSIFVEAHKPKPAGKIRENLVGKMSALGHVWT